MTFVRLDEVYRVYRMHDVEVRALRGLDMEAEEGEMVAIMGPSGSGKTTLLNLLGGVDKPTSGDIVVGPYKVSTLRGKDLTDYRRKIVGHIFQTLNLVPTLTASENIALPLVFSGTPKAVRRERVEELLKIMELADRRNHKPDELSGGEQQRVAIATALANDPPVILADEPTGELDSETSKTVVDFLVEINRRYRKTVFLVTHNPIVAAECPRILRIEDGRIQGSYTAAQMKSRTPIGYLERLRKRIREFDKELRHLDEKFKATQISGEKFEQERLRVQAAKRAFLDEMHRYGT
jgi:putative ABC transport system ATP-binding protein